MRRRNNNYNKRGQVTAFIIIGVIIIAAILLFLLLRKGTVPGTGGGNEVSPKTFLETCLSDSIVEATNIIGEQGGYVNPQFYINFKFASEPSPIKITYLCYTDEYNKNCVNQEPMLFQHVEGEIKDYINPVVETCFTNLASKYSKEGYTVEVRHTPGNFNVELKRNLIDVKINGELILTKTGETTRQKDFEVKAQSGLYDILIFPVQEILRKKSSSLSCYFDSTRYGLLYDDFDISSTTANNSVQIYTIEYKKTKEIFRFAVRSCVANGGYGV